MTNSLTIVHTVPSIAVNDGGPSYTVCALASAQAKHANTSVHLITRLASRHSGGTNNVEPSNDVTLHDISGMWPRTHFETYNTLRRICSNGHAVVHDQGIWHPQNIACASFAVRHRLPYVISIHGMLEPWALAHKRRKKILARWLYQDRLLNSARCLIAASEMEHESLRQAGCRNPIALVPMGIDSNIPVLSRTEPASPKTALFLSRIHPKKGLVHAIEAWNILRPNNWRLEIVGPSEGGHRQELENLVNKYGLQMDISFREPVTGIGKYQCYWNADLFLLPTYSENFGVVVAEALACKVPVLTTIGTPWKELPSKGCGWFIDIGTAPLVAALDKIIHIESAELKKMGERGREWVLQDFQWSTIAANNIAVYEWVMRRGPKPDFVYQL